MLKKHSNIALFIPHNGCPHTCSFCNQVSISGKTRSVESAEVLKACESAHNQGKIDESETELAFFGGSFTALPRDYLIELLEVGYECVKKYSLKGIRCSTRPDAIDDEILTLLKQYGVTAIELGVQSMDDEVLEKNRRGHTEEDAIKASNLIKKYDFSLGHQMMTGLYGDTLEKSMETARKIVSIKPDTIRIYPTVIIKNTHLAELYESGEYETFSFEETLDLCAELYELFYKNDIEIIRVGLHAEKSLFEEMIGGAYHPAFGELCQGRIYLKNIKKELLSKDKGEYFLEVKNGYVSKAIGHGKINKNIMNEDGYKIRFRENDDLEPFEVRVI